MDASVLQSPIDQNDSPLLPAILSFDPGGTTGWYWYDAAVSVFDSMHKGIACGQIVDQSHHKLLFDLMIHWAENRITPRLHIVCERFEFRKTDQERDKIDYDAAEYVGVVKLFVKMYKNANVKLVMQSASMVKEKKANKNNPPFWTEAKIKHLGLWEPGKPHAMDALRHMLYYRTFTLKDHSLLYHLKDFDGSR